MTAMPPEPGFGPQESHAPPTQPLPVPPPSAFPSASAFPQPPSAFPQPPPAYQPPLYPPLYPPPPDPSPEDLAGPPRRRRVGPLRIITGVIWAAIAVICAAGAVGEWLIGLHAAAVLCLVIAVGAAWYDYRVWTFKARRFLL